MSEPLQEAKIFQTSDAKGVVAETADGFDNFVSRLGLNNNNTLSAGLYIFNLMTRNRIQLEAAYRGSWVVGQVVDCVAEDMTRAGIDVTTNEAEQDIKDFQSGMSRLAIWSSMCDLIKWGRLYGGAIAVIQIEGQKLETPLKLDTIQKGQFQGLVVFDRWQLNPDLTNVIKVGPNMGLPEFYDIVTTVSTGQPNAPSATGQIKVHHSRVIRNIGIKLPFFQAITEMMWGESILERLWDRLISFDSVTMSTANLVERANNRTIGVDGYREIIAAGGKAQQALEKQFEAMREFQTNEGLTVTDKNDEFSTTNYTFAGLPDIMLQFGQQLAGASQIPLVRLFGQSPAGLSSTGESDLRMYYDGINAKQEAGLRPGMTVLVHVMWRSFFGKEAPKDIEFSFVPLWQMSATDKAAVAKSNTETILGAYEAGVIDRATSMKELRQSSGDSGLFSNITDEQIKEAEEEPAPDAILPDPDEPKEPVKALDRKRKKSFWSRVADTFKESDHPRKSDGKFGSGGGHSESSSPKVNQADIDQSVEVLAGQIPDKKWDAFIEKFESTLADTKTEKLSPDEARKVKTSHKFDFESDPDNKEMHKSRKNARGKEVKDPSILIEFDGDLYAIDGQHRLNRAIKNDEPANVVILKGKDFEKFGIKKSAFEGKTAKGSKNG